MKKAIISFFVAVLLVFSHFYGIYRTEEKKEAEKLMKEKEVLKQIEQKIIRTINERYPQTELSFMIKNLDTGNFVCYNEKQMRSASLIKLFVAEAVLNKVQNNDYELTPKREEDLFLMLSESNNEAVNRFIDDFGGENDLRKITAENEINAFIREQGYEKTELQHKMYDEAPPGKPMGYKNLTSVKDVTVLIEKLYKKELFNEPYNTKMLDILVQQKRQTKIPALIKEKYKDVIIANKTGELFAVDNDAALIMGDGFALSFVIMVDNIPLKEDGDMDIELKKDVWKTISELSLSLLEEYY